MPHNFMTCMTQLCNSAEPLIRRTVPTPAKKQNQNMAVMTLDDP